MTDAEIWATIHRCAEKLRGLVWARNYRVLELCVCCVPDNDGITLFGHMRNQCDVFSLDDDSPFPTWDTLDAAAQSELEEYRLRAGA